ncbi:MAG: GNAT family N-acetyltransferase [Gemmatimonadetes bacterium]|nr:GNAT family N-acetyltransferase [Gemmatimonadota bacterium]
MIASLRARDGSVSDQVLVDLMARCAEGAGDVTPLTRELLENLRNDEILLAFDGPTPVGVCAMKFTGGERVATLSFIGVHPDRRRAGLGRRLLLEAEGVARKNGFQTLRTGSAVDSNHVAATGLLKQAGWNPVFGASLKMWRELDDLPDAKAPAGYRIRTYETGDDAAFVRIKNAAFMSENTGGRAWTSADFEKEYLDSPYFDPKRVLFAICGDEPVGTTTAWTATHQGRDVGLIHWVAVVPEHRSKGLGWVLNVRALRKLKALGYGEAILNTSETLESAVRLYRRLGFEVILRRAVYEKPLKGGRSPSVISQI